MSAFVKNAEEVAEQAMSLISPELAKQYSLVIRFLSEHPASAPKLKGKKKRGVPIPEIGSVEYIQAMAQTFFQGRKLHPPKEPTTVPDEVVGEILHHYFNVPRDRLDKLKREHQLCMASENIVGNILEHYLADVLEKKGWAWCSSNMIKAADFIKPLPEKGMWQVLQVKNRDNSENSSSSAIRIGTIIEKWFRTYSRKAAANWENFPDEEARGLLSEDGFRAFVAKHLKLLKS